MKSDKKKFRTLEDEIAACNRCPRLVNWREKVAKKKTRRYLDWNYWGKPVPGFGDINARLLIVGLAPAAHGGNRTGRMFTGDRSGDFLFNALHKFGFANQPRSDSLDDGLKLSDCYITASARCAPPGNILLTDELIKCRNYLVRELLLLKNVKVIIALGKKAFDTITSILAEMRGIKYSRQPYFSHGNKFKVDNNLTLISSFHPSQRNTFTKKLTENMFDSIFLCTKELLKRQ